MRYNIWFKDQDCRSDGFAAIALLSHESST